MCGTWPLCYGITNFSLLIGCAIGVGLLGRALALPAWGAVLASSIWMFNWHGINMAVLWISGRTALLLVLFATFGAAAFVKQRWLTSAFLIFAAMLSKEEAVLLPPILIGWSIIDARLRKAPILTEGRLIRRSQRDTGILCVLRALQRILRRLRRRFIVSASHSAALRERARVSRPVGHSCGGCRRAVPDHRRPRTMTVARSSRSICGSARSGGSRWPSRCSCLHAQLLRLPGDRRFLSQPP
jgi:hypothetical protein